MTIAVPKAANGQGDSDIFKAELATRIQCARDSKGTPLIINSGFASVAADSAVGKAMKKAESRIANFILSMVQTPRVGELDFITQINQVVYHRKDGRIVLL